MDPTYSDPLEWITAYLAVHSLSVPSRRYSFLLWLVVVLLFFSFAVLHWTGSRGGPCGAIWSKWTLRRRTWRKRNRLHRQPVSLPSNAQLLSLAVLTCASLALTFVGPDYLAPTQKVWQTHPRASSPPSQLYDTSTFTPYMYQNTISKSLWSSSARAGQIAFALLPLCVLFALKAPPFAIFAIPFMTQLYFDKLAWLHKWAGRLIWFLVFIHVVLWSIQLTKDVNPSTGRVAYIYAWSYTPFICGWIAFFLLTLIILLSLRPIRRRSYECFYFLHVLLGPSMLVMSALHHPTVAYWCWAALSVWIGERVWRATWWIYANGVGRNVALGPPPPSYSKDSSRDTWEMGQAYRSSLESTPSHLPIKSRPPSPLSDYYLRDTSPMSAGRDGSVSHVLSPPSPTHTIGQHFSRMRLSSPYVPPPGYAHAELLSGRTVRLRIITPGFLPWSPGQHFLLNVPSISRFTSHPFTCASVCDEQAPTDVGRIMVFLVRAKSGWTQDLWNVVSRLIGERSRGYVSPALTDNSPKRGVLLRTYVDGPFGSVKRARWGNYSTGIIIVGGSGVSFGLSLLQYMCMCLAGRDGRHLGGRPGGWGRKGADLKRIRFIWLVREYSHIQWCASIIRWCTSIVPPAALQVDIFVTHFKPVPSRNSASPVPSRVHFFPEPRNFDEELQPPHPNFVRENSVHLSSESSESLESHESHESDADLNYYLGESLDFEPPADELRTAHETNILDLTNFDGDVDVALPGEAYLSRRLRKEGKLRRLRSRRLSAMEKINQDPRLPQPLTHNDARAPRRAQNPRHAYPGQHPTPLQLSPVTRPRSTLTLSIQSTDRLFAASPLSEQPNSASTERNSYSPLSYRSESPHHVYSPLSSTFATSDLPSADTFVNASGPGPVADPARGYHDVRSDPGQRHVVPNARLDKSRSASNSASVVGTSDFAPLEMDEQEAIDINIVAERARPGKPKLDKVIADEVQASRGAVVVACCGPTSLNAMVRKIVAAQIDPGRIRRGDMRGSITLVSEEFEY